MSRWLSIWRLLTTTTAFSFDGGQLWLRQICDCDYALFGWVHLAFYLRSMDGKVG